MEQLLDLQKLKQMIRQGIKDLNRDPNADQAVLFIGDTGVGKSTMLAFLSGAQMTVKMQGLKPVLDSNNKTIKIGHEKYSQTSVPNKLLINNIAFYDCPGFKDNKGQQYQISNSFFVQRLIKLYPKLKIVLLIDESHISETRADKLPKLIRNLLKSFKTFDDIKQGTLIIVNRVEKDLSKNDYYREIGKMLQLKNENGSLFNREQHAFLKYLMDSNRICLFRAPVKEQKGTIWKPNEEQSTIMKRISQSKFIKGREVANILSETAKSAIRDFIDHITEKSNVKLEAVCKEIIVSYTSRLQSKKSDVQALIEIKGDVINLAEQIKAAKHEQIIDLLQAKIPQHKILDFSQDFEAVLFFKNIYDKTATYFSNLVNKIYSELSSLLINVDNQILKVQKQNTVKEERKRIRVEREQARKMEFGELDSQLNRLRKIREDTTDLTNRGRSLLANANLILNDIANVQQISH